MDCKFIDDEIIKYAYPDTLQFALEFILLFDFTENFHMKQMK